MFEIKRVSGTIQLFSEYVWLWTCPLSEVIISALHNPIMKSNCLPGIEICLAVIYTVGVLAQLINLCSLYYLPEGNVFGATFGCDVKPRMKRE